MRSSSFGTAGRIIFRCNGLNPGDHRPRKKNPQILKIFGNAKGGWSLAFWFAALNSFLDGERPQNVLAIESRTSDCRGKG